MIIDNNKNLRYEVIDVDGDPTLIRIEFYDVNGAILLGSIQIQRKRLQALSNSLSEIFRELYSVFEVNDSHYSVVAQKRSGTISFGGE